MTDVVNVSQDLVWELTRGYNSFVVTRTCGNHTVSFSRDPLSLRNINSRKNSGLRNNKAVGITTNKEGGIVVTTKKSAEKNGNKPASLYNTTTFSPNRTNRKLYKSIINATAGKGYRSDLRKSIVIRTSALKSSLKPVKETKARKPRGKKAKAAAAAAETKA